jgi:hypothetical protein
MVKTCRKNVQVKDQEFELEHVGFGMPGNGQVEMSSQQIDLSLNPRIMEFWWFSL